jgi:hypothetical protein
METELCLLWDMTAEPDVVELLMQHNFLELASRILLESTIPRLMVSYGSGVECHNCTRYIRYSTDVSLDISPYVVSGVHLTLFCWQRILFYFHSLIISLTTYNHN